MQVIIGIDPHKASHTAVAVDDREEELSRLKVCATRVQVDKLLTWAVPVASRTWAIEGAKGLGFLLAQQLVTAGETSSMSRRHSPQGRVCWTRADRTRTTRTTQCQSP